MYPQRGTRGARRATAAHDARPRAGDHRNPLTSAESSASSSRRPPRPSAPRHAAGWDVRRRRVWPSGTPRPRIATPRQVQRVVGKSDDGCPRGDPGELCAASDRRSTTQPGGWRRARRRRSGLHPQANSSSTQSPSGLQGRTRERRVDPALATSPAVARREGGDTRRRPVHAGIARRLVAATSARRPERRGMRSERDTADEGDGARPAPR